MEANLAVLIDFENIAAGTEKEGLGRFDVDTLMKRLKDKGRILVARSYADWGRFARFKQSLLTANVNMYELTSHGMQDKNRADIAMVVDALELAFTRDYIDTFVLVSGDSDFTPLVLKMRELNKRVIGCGTRSSTSRLLIQACDEFLFYDSVVQRGAAARTGRPRPAEVEQQSALSEKEAIALLLETIEGLQRETTEPPLASVVKTAMLRKSPDFSETDLGHPSFARFLEACQEAGRVKVVRDQKSGGYRVALPEAVSSLTAAEQAPSKGRRDRERGAEVWDDPYLPPGVESWIEALELEGIAPLSASTRKAVLQAIEEVVKEREEKKRRVNVQFVQEDVRRRLKRTHPDLPGRSIRGVFNALLRANVLIHKDGTPVRTGTAPFHLDRGAEQLNDTLANVYVAALHDHDADLRDVGLLAELFYGQRDRARDVEEIVAWLLSADSGEEEVPAAEPRQEAEPAEADLDALLSFDETTAEAPPAKKAAPAKRAPRAAEPEAAPPAKEKAPRKRGKAEPKAAAEAAPEPFEPVGDADGAKRGRTRTRKKKAETDEESPDLDALLEIS